jgi:hypothetical protein
MNVDSFRYIGHTLDHEGSIRMDLFMEGDLVVLCASSVDEFKYRH